MSMHNLARGPFRATCSTTLLFVFSAAFGQDADKVESVTKPTLEDRAPFEFQEITNNPLAEEAQANNVVVYGEWDGPALVNGIPLGFKVIDGDIVVPEDFDEGSVAATYAANLWPGGIVPYQFDGNVTGANANAMLVAMSWWENVAAVDFVPRNGELNFIHVQNNAFNNSPVGIQVGLGAGQIINITSWGTTAVMAHELGHSLGFWHEQSRGDRDTYVTINNTNVCQTCCQQGDGSMGPCNFNFQIQADSSNYGPYDFDSVMHYGRCFFSTNSAACNATCPSATGETLAVKPPFFAAWHCNVGQTTHLSTWDTRVMSFMYSQWNWRFQRSGFGSDFFFPGSFFLPFESFAKGYDETPVGGTLWLLNPSTHAVAGVLNKPMIIAAPLGGVTLTH